MKIGDYLYFAPGIPFDAFNADHVDAAGFFRARIEGYYLVPARLLAEAGHAFASVLLLASAMDALARYAMPKTMTVHDRCVGWFREAMPTVFSEQDAEIFYNNFRCGLVHEARVKEGCVFTTDVANPVVVESGLMAVNADLLAKEVSQALNYFCKVFLAKPGRLTAFLNQLKTDFQNELRSTDTFNVGDA
jgi:hypothetical protein